MCPLQATVLVILCVSEVADEEVDAAPAGASIDRTYAAIQDSIFQTRRTDLAGGQMMALQTWCTRLIISQCLGGF